MSKKSSSDVDSSIVITSNIIKSMLKEKGYEDEQAHWKLNQNRDFEKEPEAKIIVDGDCEDEIFWDIEFNMYYYLLDKIRYNENLQSIFDAFSAKNKDYGSDLLTNFCESNKNICFHKVDNSFNYVSYLPQAIQFAIFTISKKCQINNITLSKGEYVLLQIQNGCDPRGTYSSIKAFTTTSHNSILKFNLANIQCKNNHEHIWDAYKFLNDKELKRNVKNEKLYCPLCNGELDAVIR